MADPLQVFFNEAEEIQQALHSQAGCEIALLQLLDPVLAADARSAHMVYAIIDSMAMFRQAACTHAGKVLESSLANNSH